MTLNNIPKPLLTDIVDENCIPIIGSGFSRNASLEGENKMPLWDDLGKILAKEMDQPYLNPIESISNYCYKYKRISLIEKLRKLLFIDSSKPGKAHHTFAKLFFRIILTTNFDFLLERSFDNLNKPYEVIVGDDQLSINYPTNLTQIMKIHGDFNHPRSMVLTEEDFDLFIENHPLLTTTLSYLMMKNTLLLIGYSMNDPDFRQIFNIIKQRLDKHDRPIYTILVNPSINERVRFERRGINVINL